jgi:MFS family permease
MYRWSLTKPINMPNPLAINAGKQPATLCPIRGRVKLARRYGLCSNGAMSNRAALPNPPSTAAPPDRPSRARLGVLGFLGTLFFILYLDRICISQAASAIQAELGLTHTEMGLVFMAFTLAYGLFEVPTGRWGDRFGSRAILTRIALWWSAFTALTAACTGFPSLLAARFLFGAGEAGAFPNSARVIARWFPAGERGRVQGVLLAASHVGGAVSPVVAAHLISLYGWRATFVIFGSLGIVWAAAFVVWFRDNPATHRGVNDAERRLLAEGCAATATHTVGPIPWPAILRSCNLWLLGTVVTCSSFNSYLYFSWYPTYLQSGRGVPMVDAGWLAGLVLAGATLGTLVGGLIADRIKNRCLRPARVRRYVGCGFFVLAASLLITSIAAPSASVSALLAAASSFAMLCQHPSWWSTVTELGGRHVGTVFGLINSLGVPGAMASQYFFGACADWRGKQGFTGREQWDPALAVYVAVLLIGGICWLFIDVYRPIDAADDARVA